MSSTSSRWIPIVILALVAIFGWGAYYLSSQSPETAQSDSADLDSELEALQQKYAELQSEQESLLQENIALRSINEGLQSAEMQDTRAERTSFENFPGGREKYLEKRLQYASEQLRRHRRGMYQQSAALTSEPQETAVSELLNQAESVSDQQAGTENQQLREQLAKQAARFGRERVIYTQTIELLASKIDEAFAATMIPSKAPGDESPASDTVETSVAAAQPAAESEQAAQPMSQDESADDAGSAQASAEAEANRRLQQQIDGLLEKIDTAEQNLEMMAEAREENAELNRQLQAARGENKDLNLAVQALNERVNDLSGELHSANERTHSMEMMTEAITEENHRFGQLIDALQDTLGLTIAEKDSQISSIQSAFTMIEYSTDILFESGSTQLSENGKQILKEFIVNLESEDFADRVINIEGHTDDVPISGDLLSLYPTNWELSLARAASATRYLIELGIDAERLRPVGRGSSQPRAPNDTETGKASNRRIEIHLAPELARIQN